MRISDWSSDVCSSDLALLGLSRRLGEGGKLGHIIRLVLDDHLGVEIPRELLEAVMGGQRVGAIDVEARDAAHLAILGEVILVARNQDRKSTRLNSSH